MNKRRMRLLAIACVTGLLVAVLYVLSYTPYLRFTFGPDSERKWQDNPLLAGAPEPSVTLPFYAPIEYLAAKGTLREPLLAWARLWDVEERAELQFTERYINDVMNSPP